MTEPKQQQQQKISDSCPKELSVHKREDFFSFSLCKKKSMTKISSLIDLYVSLWACVRCFINHGHRQAKTYCVLFESYHLIWMFCMRKNVTFATSNFKCNICPPFTICSMSWHFFVSSLIEDNENEARPACDDDVIFPCLPKVKSERESLFNWESFNIARS